MRIRKCFALLPLVLLILSGCTQKKESSESAYHIEYLNTEKTGIVKVEYTPETTDTEQMVEEFLRELSADPKSVEYRKTIPSDVFVTNYSIEGMLLTLNFSPNYQDIPAIEEVLRRAAIVRTMTQIEGIDCVAFLVADTPLTDSYGNAVGAMTKETFIENPGEQINSIQNATLTLYFANEEGNGLVKETRNVYYSSNISIEKLIMEQLLEGPASKECRSAIPSGTNLVNISVVDGICYVSLSETFRNHDYTVAEEVVIYSIVDSLSEIPTINKVQISVNGDTSGAYRDNLKLDSMFSRNLDYVVKSGTEEELNENTELEESEKND